MALFLVIPIPEQEAMLMHIFAFDFCQRRRADFDKASLLKKYY